MGHGLYHPPVLGSSKGTGVSQLPAFDSCSRPWNLTIKWHCILCLWSLSLLVSSLNVHSGRKGRCYFWPVEQWSALSKSLHTHLIDRDHTLWSTVYFLQVCLLSPARLRVPCSGYHGNEHLLIWPFTILFRIFTWITEEKKKARKQMRKWMRRTRSPCLRYV